MNILEDLNTYYQPKIPPIHIQPIIKYLKEYGNDNQLIFHYCISIICDWTYHNNAIYLYHDTDYIEIIRNLVFDNPFHIFDLDIIFKTLFNILEDTPVSILHLEKCTNRLKYCDERSKNEWFILIDVYSAFFYNDTLSHHVCNIFINSPNNWIKKKCVNIIYNFCKFDNIKILHKYNLYDDLMNCYNMYHNEWLYTHPGQNKSLLLLTCNNIITILEYAVKNQIYITFNQHFLEHLYTSRKIYDFLKILLEYQYEKYFNHYYIRRYTEIILERHSMSSEYSHLTFLSTLLKTDFEYNLYAKSICRYISYLHHQIINKQPHNIKYLLVLARTLYDYNPKLLTKPQLKKYIFSPNSDKYFCQSLKELAYLHCRLNNIKVFKQFNAFTF